MSVPPPKTTVIRHPRFYYSNGSVIFRVEDTLYKVVRDMLKKDSEIFCGMFDLDLGGPLPKTEGTIDEDPIKLYSTTVEQFDLYLEASGG